MHYFAHQTNLAIIILSNVLLVHQLEGILQSMYIYFLTVRKSLQNSRSLQIFSTPRATRFYEMSRPAGFLCFPFQKESILNTSFSLRRFTLRVQKVILPTKIWVLYVTWNLFWGCHVYCHCLSVSISSSRLCKGEMFLYAILWRLSSWPSLNCRGCIVILLPSSRNNLWWFQCNWKLAKCNNADAMVFWFEWWRRCRIPCILFLWTQVPYL